MSGTTKRAREAVHQVTNTTPGGKDNMVLVRGKMVNLETLNPKERRRVKNILSAQRSREKTKEHINKLEKRVADGEARIAGLVRENYALRSMLAQFMSQAAKGAGGSAAAAMAAPGVTTTPRAAATPKGSDTPQSAHTATPPPARPLPALGGSVLPSPAGSPTGGGVSLPAASGARAARMLRTAKSHEALKVETPSPMGKSKAKRPRRVTRSSARIRASATESPNQMEDAAFSPAPPTSFTPTPPTAPVPLSLSVLRKTVTPPKDAIVVTTPGAGDEKMDCGVKQISLLSPEPSLMGSLPEPLSLMSNSGAFGSPMLVGSPAVPHRPDSFLRMSGWAEASGEMPGKNVVGPQGLGGKDSVPLEEPSTHLRHDSVETELTGGPSVATTVSDVVTGTILKDACMSSPLLSSNGWNF